MKKGQKLLRPCPICGQRLEHTTKCKVSNAANERKQLLSLEREVRRQRAVMIRRVRACREARVPQEMLADALGVSKGAIQQMEAERV